VGTVHYTHTTVLRPSWTLSGTTLVNRHQKGKTSLDLLEQEIVSGSGISWIICKSAPWPRHNHASTPPSGIAMVGHRWARAHPTSKGRSWDLQNSKSFFGGVGMGDNRLHMSLKVYHISSMNTSRKCVCPLQIVYAYLASGGKAPRPPLGLCLWTPLGDFHLPDILCPPYLQTLAMPLTQPLKFFTGRMLFLPPNQQHQSTEGKKQYIIVQCSKY